MTPKVFIVDDDAAVRDAMRRLLESAGLQVEAYDNGPSFLASFKEDREGCVLLDMAMPGMNGHEVHAAMNKCNLINPVIFLTGHGNVPMAVSAVQSGAMDFLEKPVPGNKLLERVRRALALDEERRKERAHIRAIQEDYARLSPRQREIMALVVAGMSSKEIARQLGLSHRTVEAHRTHVMHKLGATNIVELMKLAVFCKPD